MRVTFILPDTLLCGGVKCTFEVANHLQDLGHQVSVVYPLVPIRNGRKWYNLKKLAGRLARTVGNITKPNRVDWFDLKANLVRVTTLNRRFIPDGDIVVATWWANAFDVVGYPDEKGKKFHFIRGYETWGGPTDLVDKSYTLPIEKVATSTFLVNLMKDKFDVSVKGPLPDGIDLDAFYMERGFEAGVPRRIGLFYRSNRAVKGMREGLLALEIVRSKGFDFDLVLFGAKPYPEDLEMIERLSPVEYHESPYGDELRSIYNSLDIYVLPSLLEGFGVTPMEAMACGAACVTTDVGGVPDYTINGETAMCVPPGQPGELAEAIISLLADEERRRDVARAGNEHIQRFTWDNTVKQLEEAFKSAIS